MIDTGKDIAHVLSDEGHHKDIVRNLLKLRNSIVASRIAGLTITIRSERELSEFISGEEWHPKQVLPIAISRIFAQNLDQMFDNIGDAENTLKFK